MQEIHTSAPKDAVPAAPPHARNEFLTNHGVTIFAPTRRTGMLVIRMAVAILRNVCFLLVVVCALVLSVFLDRD